MDGYSRLVLADGLPEHGCKFVLSRYQRALTIFVGIVNQPRVPTNGWQMNAAARAAKLYAGRASPATPTPSAFEKNELALDALFYRAMGKRKDFR